MSNNLEKKDPFVGETFADLRFVRFGCHQRAKPRDFKVHSRQYLLRLSISGYLQFDALLRRICGVFLAGKSFSQRRRTAVTKRRGVATGPKKQLCLSSRRSSFLPSSLQRWAAAASSAASSLRSLLDMSAASFLLGAEVFVAALTVSAMR